MELESRASFQKNKLDLASKYFEKAVDYLISTEGDVAPELIPLYQEIAKIKQMKKIHEKSISYALQAHSVSLALYQKFSPEVGSSALFLGKAYAARAEEKHTEAAERYFNESLVAYKETLGMDHPQTISTLQVFSKWLGLAGKRKGVQIQTAIYGSHHKEIKNIQELLDMMNRITGEQKLSKCLKQDKKPMLICSIPDL